MINPKHKCLNTKGNFRVKTPSFYIYFLKMNISDRSEKTGNQPVLFKITNQTHHEIYPSRLHNK